ncbi:hypothetical protein [Kallotenue papyrolyticum]|uniref:hypothetical protein n=1 Tax=Kallotenue papyrolyticum TaxID=1325125 RepID=UPI00047861C2|nr:hypothetical protein [Kallotenue papyrolyticum]
MSYAQRAALIVVLIVGTLVVSAPRVVYACSCVAPGTPQQELAQADAVFGGTVTAIEAGGRTAFAEARRVHFAVARVWKGALTEQATVLTAASSASCGYEFQPGGEYLVYARLAEGQLQVSLCSRTQPTANAGADLAALGAGQPPVPAPAAAPSPPATSDAGVAPMPGALLLWGVLALLVLALVVATIVLARRPRTMRR